VCKSLFCEVKGAAINQSVQTVSLFTQHDCYDLKLHYKFNGYCNLSIIRPRVMNFGGYSKSSRAYFRVYHSKIGSPTAGVLE